MATLTLEHLVKDYPGNVRAVDELSLKAADGELLVLVGPSGCGKTTTLRLIAGLEPITRGTVSLAGKVVNRLPPKDRDVAMVFQSYALYPHMTVAGNMAFGLKLRRTGKAEIERRLRETAELLGIAGLLQRRPGQLSGGERQRVALGRAIVRKPGLFLFDEPLSNLDAALRMQMRREIRRLHARLGATMVYVTHDQTEAMTLGQRIAVMCDGRIQQVADGTTLYNHPANRFVAGLIGSPAMNFFTGRIQRHHKGLIFHIAGGVSGGGNIVGGAPDGDEAGFTLPIPPQWSSRLASYIDGTIILGVRPEHVGSPAAEAVPDAPRIPARVEAVEPIGPDSYVYLNRGGHTFVSRADPGGSHDLGEHVEPAVSVDHLHFFDPKTHQAVQ